MRVEGIVFDLDATLVNLGGFVEWMKAEKRVVDIYNLSGCPGELIRSCSDKGLFNLLNRMRDELSLTMPSIDVARIQNKVFKAVEECEAEGIGSCHLMPECIPTLEWLKKNNIKMGIATSNSQDVAEQTLRINGIHKFFTSLVGRRVDLRMKPYPDQILVCFNEIEVDPIHGVVVGDSARDVKAAKSAGAYAIAVPSHFTRLRSLKEAGVDKIIEHLGILPSIMQELNSEKGLGRSTRPDNRLRRERSQRSATP